MNLKINNIALLIFISSLLFGVAFWVADSIYQLFYFKENLIYMVSNEPMDILDSLFFSIPRNSLVYRICFLISAVTGGAVAAFMFAKYQEREKAIRQGEARFRESINAVNDGIFNLNIAGGTMTLNSQCHTMLGYDPDEFPVTLEVWQNMIHPADRNKTLTAINASIASKEPFAVEYRLKTKNGAWLWVLCRGHVSEWDHEGFPVRISGTNTNVDERVLTQHRLQEYAERLEEAESNAHFGHWEYDHSRKSWTWSNEIYQIVHFKHELGFTPTRKEPIDYIHKDDMEMVKTTFEKSLNNKTVFNISNRLMLGDGTIKYVHVRGHHRYDETGKPQRSFGTVQDITEARRTEEALYDSEKRYRALFENINEGILVIDIVSGRIKHANKAICQMFGYNHDEILHISLRDLHQRESFESDSRWGHLLPGEKVTLPEIRCRKRDGSFILVNITASAIEIDGRKCASAIFFDLTEGIKIENERNILNLAADNSGIEIFVYNPDGTCHYANTAACKRLGYSITQLKNMPIHSIDKNFEQQGFADLWEKLKEGKNIRMEGVQTNINGDSFPVEYTADFLSIGNSEYACLYIQDITERKHFENELVTAKDKAENSDKLKTIFLANMSHEIRTPMNGIMGFAELLQHRDITDDKKNEYAKVITECGNNLLQIINDILDISKIEAGGIKPQKSEFSLNKMMGDLYNFFEPLVNKDDHNISFEMKKTLRDDECIIYSDENRLRQIIINLLSNSLKFTSSGYVVFGYFEKGSAIEFYVKDSGIGIPKDKHESIFEPFRQAEESLSKKYRGTGLGLAIVKNFVKLLNGTLRLESEVNKGSCFYFTIPLERPPRDAMKELSRLSIMKTTVFNWENKKILIVEDDKINFMLLHKLLESTGAEILHAATAQEAVDMALQISDLDLILMDIRLPDFTGWEASQIIKKQKPNLPIIVQTANAMMEDREKTFNCGCDGYITKPISKSVLFNTIHGYLS
jgi:PAS domain S-box-containing protein